MGKGYLGNYGDYEHAEKPLSLLDARLSFIYAIAKTCPQVFEALHEMPLKAYQETSLLLVPPANRGEFWYRCIGCLDSSYYLDGIYRYKGYESEIAFYNLPSTGGGIAHLENCPPWPYAGKYVPESEYESTRKELLPPILKWWDVLRNWADKYHINIGWMLHFAFLKLDSYAERSRNKDSRFTYHYEGFTDYFGKGVQPQMVESGGLYRQTKAVQSELELEPFNFTHQPWRPALFDEASFRRSVKEYFQYRLDTYMEQSKEKLLGSQQIKRIPKKKNPDHYEWLARYQCNKETHDAIAENVMQRRETVRDAIKDVAALIEIPLRTPRRGRKKGIPDEKKWRHVVRRKRL